VCVCVCVCVTHLDHHRGSSTLEPTWPRSLAELVPPRLFQMNNTPMTSHRTTPHHATPRHATPHHATPRHATPRHVTPRHTMPHHTTPTIRDTRLPLAESTFIAKRSGGPSCSRLHTRPWLLMRRRRPFFLSRKRGGSSTCDVPWIVFRQSEYAVLAGLGGGCRWLRAELRVRAAGVMC
jgi:hypothetical protein